MSLPALLPRQAPRIRGILATTWRGLRIVSRARVDTDSPICQVFINGDGKRTVYTLINFPSLFAPSTAAACGYDVTLYDGEGEVVARKRLKVPAFGTLELRPNEIFEGPLPEVGLLSAQIVAGSRFSFAGRHLGPVRAHFFALYHDEDMRSMAVVHPQSLMWAERQGVEPWKSNLVICPNRLERIELYQINPTPSDAQTDLKVCDLDGTELSSSSARMPPRGARRVFWDATAFRTHDHVVVASSGLTASNAKPLLFQYRSDGFSASHA